MDKLQQFKAINWVDGMKVSSTHFLQEQNFILDQIRDANAVKLNNYNFGLLPSLQAQNTMFELNVTATNDAQLVIHHCKAITPAGFRIEIVGYKRNLREILHDLHPNKTVEGDYFLYVAVNPYNRTPSGEIDPEELPPRHPNTEATHSVNLIHVDALGSNLQGKNFVILGKLSFQDGRVVIDPDFIPPATSLRSHNRLQSYYQMFWTLTTDLRFNVFKILQKASHQKENRVMAEHIRRLCRSAIEVLSDHYFQLVNKVQEEPPIVLIEIYSRLALRLHDTLQIIPNAEMEEMQSYIREWSKVEPNTFLSLLQASSEINYNHLECGKYCHNIQSLLECLNVVFGALSELDYLGQRQENIIVTEQEVRSTTKTKKGWSIID